MSNNTYKIKRDKTHSLSRKWEKAFKKASKAKDRKLNKQLAIKMKSEFDKDKKRKAGQDEFGVILLDEEPEWVWMRTDESGNNIVLRLNQENGYIINVTQGDTEIMDYELGDGDNVINIYQNQ